MDLLYLYLDESGDLGFDFSNDKTTKFFTVTVMLLKGFDNNRRLINVVKKTIKRKLPNTHELKGSNTSIEVKRYFYDSISSIMLPFCIYTLTFDKGKLADLRNKKNIMYNFMVKTLIDKIPDIKTATSTELIIDKSKNKLAIENFNKYIIGQSELKECCHKIRHSKSHENYGIQAVDLFSWGIFRKYEQKDLQWYNIFETNIKYDNIYPPPQ